MKISLDWLKDYVEIKLGPEQLAEKLTMAGTEVVSIEKRAGDTVFEIEVTSNRPDLLSYLGVAREVAAVTGGKIKTFGARHQKPPMPKDVPGTKTVRIEVKDKKPCPRYTGRVIRGIKVRPSPKWLKEKLEAAGLRPVNNVVDITNYVLLETGQPLHAFDYDKLKGHAIVVRRAKKGERITTIDGVERQLSDEMLVIADSSRAVAIAGVIGGKDTEVTERTKNILLESACFEPTQVRRTSRGLGISTDSSYRFERGIDLSRVLEYANRAAGLIAQEAQAEAVEAAVDIGAKKGKTSVITLGLDEVSRVLVCLVPAQKIIALLKALGLDVAKTSAKSLKVGVPSFRADLYRPIDLIEEISRIYGYDKIPLTIPRVIPSLKDDTTARLRAFSRRVSDYMVSSGFAEVMTYSLVSASTLSQFKIPMGANLIRIQNPISLEYEWMRPCVWPCLVRAAAYNINRKTKDLRLFELGSAYINKGNSYQEKKVLSVLATGRQEPDWLQKPRPVSFFDLKGAAVGLCARLGIGPVELRQTNHAAFEAGAQAAIVIRGKEAGLLLGVAREIAVRNDIEQDIFIAELDLGMLFELYDMKKRVREAPRFPSVVRDISMVVKRDVSSERIVSLIEKNGAGLIEAVRLIDFYSGKQIPADKKGLTYSVVYRSGSRTLLESEIEKVHTSVKNALAGELGVEFR